MIDVVVILGSKSDKEIAKKAIGIFDRFGLNILLQLHLLTGPLQDLPK